MKKTDRTTAFEGGPCILGAYCSGDNVSVFTDGDDKPKEEILKAYEHWKLTNARNSMGCLEDWYSYPFSISRTFSREEIENMDEKTIGYLVRLANNISDALY